MDKMVSSKILDDAREKIALEYLAKEYGLPIDAIKLCIKENKIQENHITDAYKLVDQILNLSGTTDIECPDCKGEGSWVEKDDACNAVGDPCDKCNGTGVIKHPWKVSVVLENGELL